MQQEKTNKYLAALFWVLTVICFIIIFYFSSQTADESSEQSTWFLVLLSKWFGEGFTDFFVRKLAHFLEYTGTAFLAGWAFYFTVGKNKYLLPVALTSLYAVTDEVHQIFVEGRSCQVRDWAIDTLGALLGAAVFTLCLFLIKKIKKGIDRRKTK